MSLVAAETQVERAPPASSADSAEWQLCGLYMGNLDEYANEAIVDVLKMTARSGKLKSVPVPSISNAAWQAKDELTKDPYNMKKINNLGYVYSREGQHEQCLNIMMRGWKRAPEIQDPKVRFRFLMKLCELSLGLWKFRQALAVLRDIAEPDDPKELKSYLILGTQVWCNNGDLQQGLKFFQRAIENESFDRAVRIFAIVAVDLKKAGAFEAAKSTMENLSRQPDEPNIATISAFIEGQEKKKETVTPETMQRRFVIGASVAGAMVFLYILYLLEARSLASLKST